MIREMFQGRRIKLTIILVVVLLLVLPLAFRQVAEIVMTRRLDRYVAGLEAKGYRTSIFDLVRIVPREKNAAVLWREMLSSGTQALISIDPALYEDRSMILYNAMIRPASFDPADRAALAQAFASDPPLVTWLRRIAACPDYGLESQDFSRSPYMWEGPKLAGVMKKYRILFAGIAVLVAEGQLDRARDLWQVGIRSSRHFIERPTSMMGFIIGQAIREMALGMAEAVFRNQSAPTAELLEAIHDLDPTSLCEQFREMLDQTRASILGQDLNLLNTGRPYQEPKIKFSMGANQQPKLESVFEKNEMRDMAQQIHGWMLRPLLRREIIDMQEFCLARQEIFRKDPWLWTAGLKGLGTQQTSVGLTQWYLKSAETELLTAFDGRARKVVRTMAHSQLIRLALACKAYHNDQGVWPSPLDALSPKYLDKIPLNPALGKPFIYQPRPNGFTLATVADVTTSTTQGNGVMSWREGE